MSETKVSKRGFHEKGPAARELLETIGEMFLTGYAYAAEAGSTAAAEDRLEGITRGFRGFAYEGAAMAFAVRDGLRFGTDQLASRLIAGRGRSHIYMAYAGMGWALGRLPRFRWAKVTGSANDPLLRWLLLDGYGFHQAFFHTDRYVRDQYRDPSFRWPPDGRSGYAPRAIDQGIGRALWFVAGSDTTLVADIIGKFSAERQPDLYSGAGLAATYAGGSDEEELQTLWQRAGEYRPNLAQGAAFAAETRVRADLVVPHTEMATRVLCDMSPEEASRLTARLRPNHPVDDGVDGGVDDGVPAYERWRVQITDHFAAVGRC